MTATQPTATTSTRSGSDAWPAIGFLQYTHLDKSHGYLPGMTAAQPAIFAMTDAEYRAARARFADHAAAAATDLLGDTAVAAAVDAWVGRGAHTVLAIGDSLTDDLQSWAEILRAALDQRHPGHRIRLVNRGLSAHTTAMLLRGWPGALAAVRPEVVVCALGGNDVTRIGPDARKTQVSLEESVANLAELRRIAAVTNDPAWLWMTPAPVDEARAATFPPFAAGGSSWRNSDITALARRITALDEPSVDLTRVFGVPARPDLVGDDGVHPTLTGQQAIATAVVGPLSGLRR